ncbi:MAG: acetylornithine carbamoyltransferase, partial [Saprospiraceae bacterium]|nr:acetylornithine carbamoyltransferase [Saprospiraceae bacterium]
WKLEFEDGRVMDGDKAEHIREAAAVISQYADVIGIRTFPDLDDRHRDYQDLVLKRFIEFATVPVVSLESATRHPLQSLADWMTIEEYRKTERPKVVLSWAPHPRALPQSVPNSFVEWLARAEVDLLITHPEGCELAPEFADGIPVVYDQDQAFEGADFIYAKNWSSYREYGKIAKPKKDWKITTDKMKRTNDAFFMHCLPVRRNVVVADEVLQSDHSLHLHQADNRTHAAQAVLEWLLKSR